MVIHSHLTILSAVRSIFGAVFGLGFMISSVLAQTAQDWMQQINFRPSAIVQTELMSRPSGDGKGGVWYVQKIENGQGPLCLDNFEFTVTKFPSVSGRAINGIELLSWMRRHLGEYLDPAMMTLRIESFNDRFRWESSGVAGAVALADLKHPWATGTAAFFIGEQASSYFILCPVKGAGDTMSEYPVQGNRWIGINSFEGSKVTTVFTKAAYRVSPTMNAADVEKIIAGEEALWKGFIENLKKVITDNRGTIGKEMKPVGTTKVDWDAFKSTLHIPVVKWMDPEGSWESSDPKSRFRIEIKPGLASCDFIERAGVRREVRKSLPLLAVDGPGGGLLIERSNTDADVLELAGFNKSFQEQIIKASPRPSRLIFTRKGNSLVAKWEGIRVTKDGKGNLATIREPGTTAGIEYKFARVP